MAKYDVIVEDCLVKVSVDLFLSPDAIAKLDYIRNDHVLQSGNDLSLDSVINSIIDTYLAGR